MISRRAFGSGLIAYSLCGSGPSAGQPTEDDGTGSLDQLIYPPFGAIDAPRPFGYKPPDEKQKRKAEDIVKATIKGPRPIDIAQSFIERFYTQDPEAISQWPAPAPWNPLIVEFFSATTLKANNDMVAWCAAFANWCLERSGRRGSKSAASQSFLDKKTFKRSDDPVVGDLAIFTCYDKITNKSLGLGHVAFVKEKPANGHVKVVGGNQSADGHASIISRRDFVTGDRDIRRHVGVKYALCTMRLNTYISIV